MTSFANIYPAKEPLGLELADNIVRSKGKLRMDFQLTFFGELDSFESNSTFCKSYIAKVGHNSQNDS